LPFDGADHTLNVRLQASGPGIRAAQVDKIVQSTVGEGNAAVTACVGQGFWDQEAPGNGLLVGYPKHYWKLRLGMVAMFTAIFAAVIGLLTNARRAEIFGSTAAYAAVLVVFVSGNLGPDATAGN
jgi:hypothetical protein